MTRASAAILRRVAAAAAEAGAAEAARLAVFEAREKAAAAREMEKEKRRLAFYNQTASPDAADQEAEAPQPAAEPAPES